MSDESGLTRYLSTTIRDAMGRTNTTQTALAERAGISEKHLSQMLTGHAAASVATWGRVALAAGVRFGEWVPIHFAPAALDGAGDEPRPDGVRVIRYDPDGLAASDLPPDLTLTEFTWTSPAEPTGDEPPTEPRCDCWMTRPHLRSESFDTCPVHRPERSR